MEGIFLSYRREESAGHAGRIYDRLREKFGKNRVFMDVSAIEPGVDFMEAIDRAVASCAVLLVVIGRSWLECANSAGKRRLDDPKDFIRLEVGTALRRTIRVIPVLVQGAEMPDEEALPEELKLLARRNAIEINDTHWDSDLNQLVETLERVLSNGAEPAAPLDNADKTDKPGKKNRLTWLISSITALLLALTGLFTGIDSFRDAFVKLFKGTPAVTTIIEKPPVTTTPPTSTRKPPHPVTAIGPDAPATQQQRPPKTIAAQLVVPNVVGLTLEKAGSDLKKLGFSVEVAGEHESSDVPAGTVLRHFPKAGDTLKRGGKVELVMAIKPEPKLVTVPNVVRQPLEQAVKMLSDAGLQKGTETPRLFKDLPQGTVVKQTVAAGTQVTRGTSVDLWVAVPLLVKSPPPKTVRKVLARGNLDVRQTFLFDLDTGREVQSGDSDIWFEAVTAKERYLTPKNGATIGVVRAAGDYESCSGATLSDRRIPVNKLPDSIAVCVRTSRGNLGSFKLREPVGPSPGVLKIMYVVWE